MKNEDFRRILGVEIDRLIRTNGGYQSVAERSGVGMDTLYRWAKAESEPKIYGFMCLMAAVGRVDSLENWASQILSDGADEDLIYLPTYNVLLAAGNGSITDRGEVIDRHPFKPDHLMQICGRADGRGLALFEARGDSMSPTINDRDLIMVDTLDTRIRDGIFAYSLGDEARVKRFQKTFEGLKVISDNADMYAPEMLDHDTANQLNVIGQVVWNAGLI